ncbi:MAG: TlpA family protein disulfide reductase [Flavobacteriales bacterium]|nr:TlpA family protein disulfide reductase [Flavobacteriales bacterium]
MGAWHMALDLDSTEGHLELPFRFDVTGGPEALNLVIHNQDEAITVDSVSFRGDSIRIRMPFFDSEFLGALKGDSAFQGVWINHYKGPDYRIPFLATAGAQPRFPGATTAPSIDLSGDWEVHFTHADDPDQDEPAIGIFTQDKGQVKGSFATPSGDLRFLEGVITGDSLFLSTFNGSMAYLFRAAIHGDSLSGDFHSGHRWAQPWYAVRNPHFTLPDDESMTKLNPDHPVAFSFPGVDGHVHSSSDEQYKGKVVVLDIMGTWCPNCLDEARMLQEFQQKYQAQGLEVVSLCFERGTDDAKALEAIRRFGERLGITYSLLYAGQATKENVAQALPFIDRLKAYPTTLIIGRDGRVGHIYTGIYGPGTGARYIRFKERMENAIVQLLNTPAERQ